WNRTEAEFDENTTLHGRFEKVAATWPDAVAVVSGATQLTYAALNGYANRIALHLGVHARLKPGDLVGLVMEKSERMIAVILAVWKAGAAYVPIDLDYPDERIRFMLDDTRARLVVTDGTQVARLRALVVEGQPVITVDRIPEYGESA